jgi:hypothetical protein
MDNWNRWGAADERGPANLIDTANLIDAGAVHRWPSGLMYNGHEASSVTSRGARRCGVEKGGPIVTSFLLVIAPLPLVGAVGSPVSPVAVV